MYLRHDGPLDVLSGSSEVLNLLSADVDASFYEKSLESCLASMLIDVGVILHLSDNFIVVLYSVITLKDLIFVPIKQHTCCQEYFKFSYTVNQTIISLWLKELICTLHALCFGINKYIITCVEVDFFAGFGIYAKN